MDLVLSGWCGCVKYLILSVCKNLFLQKAMLKCHTNVGVEASSIDILDQKHIYLLLFLFTFQKMKI